MNTIPAVGHYFSSYPHTLDMNNLFLFPILYCSILYSLILTLLLHEAFYHSYALGDFTPHFNGLGLY